ncbi:5-fold beta-flower protein [Chryseobacterium sp. PMSZPI]|uniref:5-fold beta-flower protein n=1 Tax=Chryseobacterium sp. PMSZPI TaxID=1033900 RepID=UPI000C3469DE|nr:hypothetical protein [Chryseobacterium sp. PMSZPI]PKF73854.1 hypothetical protein CW752_11985 [Chryseobacterium sp. PMSZPI]
MKKTIFIGFLFFNISIISAQLIESGSHNTNGYIKSDGTIESSSHSTVGYVKKDGTIENSSHSTLGYIKDDGTVENSSHSTIGYAKGIKKEWAAVVYFFFKLN